MDSALIVRNIIDDLNEINDWGSVVDAVQANGVHIRQATPSMVLMVLKAIKNSEELFIGRVHGGFENLEKEWTPEKLCDDIFSSEDTYGAMWSLVIRTREMALEDPRG